MLCTSAWKCAVPVANSGSLLTTVVAREEPEVGLVELSVVEQRYHAVMEVLSGMPKSDPRGIGNSSREDTTQDEADHVVITQPF